ncbi:Hypothetical_protein [Hexamita inflata]|uniref:Hypothetical_protein n=1 Tax=Hexamita inflata TaxID=28002 RepID=A0AA86TA86_9EUKA|nr:Hypothetical protein HINF_LOCUS1064 [Hexamita inflata]
MNSQLKESILPDFWLNSSAKTMITTNITSSDSKYYSFGGIIGIIDNSALNLFEMLFKTYQLYSTQHIQNSGSLIGVIYSQLSLVSLLNMCIEQLITTKSIFGNYGIVGFTDGSVVLDNIQISQNISGISSSYLGIVGVITANSIQSSFSNIFSIMNTYMSTTSHDAHHISFLLALMSGKQCQINNVVLQDSNIAIPHDTSVYITDASQTNVTIQDSIIQRCQISADYAAIISWGYNSIFSLTNIQISFFKVFGINAKFIYNTDSSCIFKLQTSSTYGYNYINNVLQYNCPQLTNALLPQGC